MILIVNSFLLSFIYETILVDMTTSKVGAVPSHGDHGASSYLATCATVLNAEHFAHAARKLGFNATDLMLHKFIDLHSLWWNVGRWWSFVCQPRHSYGMSNRKENQFKKEVEHRKSWFLYLRTIFREQLQCGCLLTGHWPRGHPWIPPWEYHIWKRQHRAQRTMDSSIEYCYVIIACLMPRKL